MPNWIKGQVAWLECSRCGRRRQAEIVASLRVYWCTVCEDFSARRLRPNRRLWRDSLGLAPEVEACGGGRR